ncbi:MFS general substrate transporter [Aspergillus piperis CBS 112811]|uniref:MFS general substrate transporter n=1 Tax=Aspergillus piperis CBS 112811 TaxID=1448313 RepID=A0A8G1RCR6_9EURO|nr:MFS general substrate transporter [Aspergillus piperis CBS 112811]RAH60880.1 MFS general substrate transporter [Aspergillus piperis CBS 112811]
MPLTSTIIAPAVDAIEAEFHVTSDVKGSLTVSLFLLTYCLGPLVLAPLSKLLGRVPIQQSGNAFFLASDLAAGFSKSITQLLVFRLLSGLDASASLATGVSTNGDIFPKEQRGLSLALLNMDPVLGFCLSIAAGYITEYSTWRWAFHATPIFAGVIILTSLSLSRETYAPVLLHRKKQALQLMPDYRGLTLLTQFEQATNTTTPSTSKSQTLTSLYHRTLFRSLRLLLTQPIVQALSLYHGYIYGLVYLILSTFPHPMENPIPPARQHRLPALPRPVHRLPPRRAQTCALVSDKIYLRLKTSNHGIGKPESRLPLMIPASLLVPIGFFIYGWSAQYRTHWIVPDIGIVLPLMGATVIFQCTSAYLLEAYSVYGASANGGVYILRGLTGFGFPLF